MSKTDGDIVQRYSTWTNRGQNPLYITINGVALELHGSWGMWTWRWHAAVGLDETRHRTNLKTQKAHECCVMNKPGHYNLCKIILFLPFRLVWLSRCVLRCAQENRPLRHPYFLSLHPLHSSFVAAILDGSWRYWWPRSPGYYKSSHRSVPTTVQQWFDATGQLCEGCWSVFDRFLCIHVHGTVRECGCI